MPDGHSTIQSHADVQRIDRGQLIQEAFGFIDIPSAVGNDSQLLERRRMVAVESEHFLERFPGCFLFAGG